jgi:hypothetical protein
VAYEGVTGASARGFRRGRMVVAAPASKVQDSYAEQRFPLPTKGKSVVELAGFEPVTPSLRKMWPNGCDLIP